MDGILITARLKSTRLPGKALIDVNGKPLLSYLVNRIRSSVEIPVYICTSTNFQDDPLEKFAVKIGCKCFRGSEEDVLNRYFSCADKYGLDRMYIVYADEPFIDIELLKKTLSQMDKNKKEWVCNDQYIDGVFGYGFTKLALEFINKTKDNNKNEVWGEMVSQMDLNILRNIPSYTADKRNVRLTVDYPEDCIVIKKLLNHIGELYKEISVEEFIDVYQKMNLFDINGFRSIEYQQRIKEQAV